RRRTCAPSPRPSGTRGGGRGGGPHRLRLAARGRAGGAVFLPGRLEEARSTLEDRYREQVELGRESERPWLGVYLVRSASGGASSQARRTASAAPSNWQSTTSSSRIRIDPR